MNTSRVRSSTSLTLSIIFNDPEDESGRRVDCENRNAVAAIMVARRDCVNEIGRAKPYATLDYREATLEALELSNSWVIRVSGQSSSGEGLNVQWTGAGRAE